MSYESTTSYSGKQSVSTLGGEVRISRGRIAVFDEETNADITTIDKVGFHTYDPTINKETTRLGKQPDGVYALTTAKTGQGIIDIYGSV